MQVVQCVEECQVAVRGRLTPAARAWLFLALEIVAWEALVPPQQLLSSECDRWIEAWPIRARLLIGGIGAVIIAHLANLYPDERRDIMSQTFWREVKQWRK